MENISPAETVNKLKVNYDDKKYDVFFSYMVKNMDPKYRDSEGKIKLEAEVWGKADFKSFSIQIAEHGSKKEQSRKLYTPSYTRVFGYEFDINDRNFNIIFGGYEDLLSTDKFSWQTEQAQEYIKNYKITPKYIKDKTTNGGMIYFWNETLNELNGTDLRDILVPKLISRLETVQEVASQDINSAEELTNNVYEKHRKKNISLNNSFTEKNYGSFKKTPNKNAFFLEKMHLKINKQDVSLETYNEVGASVSEKNKSVAPKRLIVKINELDKVGLRDGTDKLLNLYIVQFCEANKIYKSDIRIIDENRRTTQVVSPKQFKDMLLNNPKISSRLKENTKQKLDEMVKVCEEKNSSQNNDPKQELEDYENDYLKEFDENISSNNSADDEETKEYLKEGFDKDIDDSFYLKETATLNNDDIENIRKTANSQFV